MNAKLNLTIPVTTTTLTKEDIIAIIALYRPGPMDNIPEFIARKQGRTKIVYETPELKAIWFGILVLMTVGIGMIAPPVGLNVYVVNSIAKDVSMNETYKGVFPFLASDALRVIALVNHSPISSLLN